jgi:hypothetical protein
MKIELRFSLKVLKDCIFVLKISTVAELIPKKYGHILKLLLAKFDMLYNTFKRLRIFQMIFSRT